jgi:hypothetical protein
MKRSVVTVRYELHGAQKVYLKGLGASGPKGLEPNNHSILL